MIDKFVLLVEDNADDEELAIFAFKQAKLLNDVVVVRDGEEALDYLFGRSSCAVGEARLPQVILLDLKPRNSVGSKCSIASERTRAPLESQW